MVCFYGHILCCRSVQNGWEIAGSGWWCCGSVGRIVVASDCEGGGACPVVGHLAARSLFSPVILHHKPLGV